MAPSPFPLAWTLEAYAKAAAAVVAASFALLVLAGGPRRTANAYLAAFMGCIAANQALEAARVVMEAHDALLFRLASVFAALDPFLLLYFFAVHPERSRALERAAWGALAVGGVLALAVPLAEPDTFLYPDRLAHPIALAAFTATAYAVILLSLARRPRREADAASLLGLGMAVVTLPTLPRLASLLIVTPELLRSGVLVASPILPRLVLPLALACAAVLAVARRPRREVAGWLAAGVAATLVIESLVIGVFLTGSDGIRARSAYEALLLAGTIGAPLRWFAFGLLASVAVVKLDLLGMTLAARRRAARALVALAFLAVGAAGLAAVNVAFGRGVAAISPGEWALLAALVAASQGTRALIDRVAHVVYGVPMRGDTAAAMEAYRSAVARAADDPSPSDAERLARLRDELGLAVDVAAVVERTVLAARGGRVREGALVAGRYRVERLLGRGGFGRAFLAHDTLLRREVALKEVLDVGPEALAEARRAGSVHHPNVVTVFDVLAADERAVIVMEHVGPSLAARLREGPLPRGEALRVLDGVLAGLGAVHAAGIVHRDLKPENVLLSPHGAPKLADFGIARAERETVVRGRDGFAGTPEFAAPEVVRGEPATPASDVYAVGVMARSLLGDADPALAAVLDRATAPSPAQRWRDAAEMREALSRVTP